MKDRTNFQDFKILHSTSIEIIARGPRRKVGSGFIGVRNLQKDCRMRGKKGDVRIRDCDERGNFVVVENAGYSDQRLAGFRLSRIVGGQEQSYTFPSTFVLGPGQTVQVLVRGHAPDSIYTHYLVFDDITWRTNGTFVTRLFNTQGIEVSSLEVRK
ncbi:unnamed protein product [Strongylus vulgaris]|uniref:LTD domain-containing protein n=1 Tax=Strongylus vulgaris TaxID=40348 RepID=A0A3P7K5S8_STRVU|nr:unnamed protein product [Strongylus vulgaris]